MSPWYGQTSPYLPLIDLLRSYFKIHERDDQREVREKVTGKLLALDRALEPTQPAVLVAQAFDSPPIFEAFRRALHDLGYREGQNLTIERRQEANVTEDRLAEVAAELVRIKVDVIVAPGPVSLTAARSATSTDHQCQDREGPRVDDPTVGVAASRRGHPLTTRPSSSSWPNAIGNRHGLASPPTRSSGYAWPLLTWQSAAG